jgi:leader peptidase (prepilin peptidase)/N-methyltransferase
MSTHCLRAVGRVERMSEEMVGGFVLMGWLVGVGGRWVLGRLRRGAVFGPPWCELVTSVLFGVLGWRFAAGTLPGWWLPVPLLLAGLGVPLAAVDLVHRRLPDALVLPGYPLVGAALAGAALGPPGVWVLVRAGLGLLVFGGAHLLVRRIAPGALGAGDVKLAGMLGAALGAVGWPALVVAPVLAAVPTLVLAVWPRGDRCGDRRGGWSRGLAGVLPERLRVASLLVLPCRWRDRTHDRTWRDTAAHGPGLLGATWLLTVFAYADLPPPG